jgi:hypothetical protein
MTQNPRNDSLISKEKGSPSELMFILIYRNICLIWSIFEMSYVVYIIIKKVFLCDQQFLF